MHCSILDISATTIGGTGAFVTEVAASVLEKETEFKSVEPHVEMPVITEGTITDEDVIMS